MNALSRLLQSVFILTGVFAPLAAAAPVPTIIVLDASGSMRERIKGESKMNIAKRAIRDLVESLPDGANLGLVVYSHRKGNDCGDIEQLIAPGKLDKVAFVAAVDAIMPNGRTPLSGALEFTAVALDYARKPANIILLSDGVETCSKDPCATITRLNASAHRLTVHAVAFDLSAKEAKSFECIAAMTGGRFLQAADAVSLKDALSVAVAETVVVSNAVPPPPPPEVLTDATLQVPPGVLAGAEFPVTWTGPNNIGDYVTIVALGTPDDSYGNFSYTRSGSPVPLTALLDAGDAEVRYMAGRSRKVLAQAATRITAAAVTLAAVDEATAGARVAITWTGPNNEGDYLTIVPKATEDGGYAHYALTRDGPALSLAAPIETGDAEIRYMSGQSRRVLARRALKLNAAEVTLSAAEQAVAGARIEITWSGPNNDGDYVTIVPRSARDDAYEGYEVTRAGSPLKVLAPIVAGDAEIRYISGQGRAVLARRPLQLIVAEVTLSAVDNIVAGGNLDVVWTGPNNDGDYVTIVMQGARDDSYDGYNYTRAGSPLKVKAPITPGAAEIRYISGQGRKVLARRALTLKPIEITLAAPEEVVAGAEVEITWTGPNNDGDYLTVVPKAMRDDGFAGYQNTRAGSPLRIAAPIDSGASEIRYVSGQGRKVLARRALNVRAAEVTLRASTKAVLGTQVAVEWTGPNNNGDHLTIVPKGTPEGRAERTAPTSRGSPASVGTPRAPGACEVRYVSGQGGRTLARVDIEIAPSGTSP